MKYGKEQEPNARGLYKIETGYDVIEVGMVTHPDIPTLAASPDGIIVKGKSKEIIGGVEIKCPCTTRTCMRYRWNIKDAESLKKEKPSYYWQCQQNMNCTGAQWWDFVVYTPFFKDDPIQIVRIERNEDDIKLINDRAVLAEEFIKTMNNE